MTSNKYSIIHTAIV